MKIAIFRQMWRGGISRARKHRFSIGVFPDFENIDLRSKNQILAARAKFVSCLWEIISQKYNFRPRVGDGISRLRKHWYSIEKSILKCIYWYVDVTKGFEIKCNMLFRTMYFLRFLILGLLGSAAEIIYYVFYVYFNGA